MDTTRSAGFANNAETAQALNNLANAAVADREAMAHMTATINSLTQQLAETNAKLSQALSLTTSLQEEVTLLRKKNPKAPPIITFDKYCWTHGPKCGHNSKECNRRAEGHKQEATDDNRMGGRETKWKSGRK